MLIGNSATPTNNHLDILRQVEPVNGSLRRVIIPLSYGDPLYADEVSARFEAAFGSRVQALREMMPVAEYYALLGEVDVMVLGHRRQQALGNLLWALENRVTVVLDPGGALFDWCTRQGLHVRTLDQLEAGVFELLDDEALRENQVRIESSWPANLALRERMLGALSRLVRA